MQAAIAARRPGRPPAVRPPQLHEANEASEVIRYVTSGRLWCDDCGGRVPAAHSGYLYCRNWRTTRTCKQRHVFRRDEVIKALARLLASPRNARAVHSATAREAKLRGRRAAQLIDELAAVERAATTLTDTAATLARTANARPSSRRAIRNFAFPKAEIAALCRRITTTRAALSLLAPQVAVDAIAAAAHARIATAARIHADQIHDPDPLHVRLLQEVIERITVAWRDGERKRLAVTVTLSPSAVYELGVEEFDRQCG